MISFNTNTGAMTALQMLGGTVQQREDVQEDVATGKEVNTAADNAALWAISEIMSSDAAAIRATSDSLSLGEATAAVAAVGAEQISETLTEMKQLAITASSGLADFSKIEAQMAQKTDQINSIISASQFNGANLLASDVDGNGGTGLSVASSVNRQGSGPATLSNINVDSVDFEGSASFDINNRTAITDAASARTALTELEGFLQYATDGAAALGASTKRMSDQNEFAGKMADAIAQGISALTDTNMEEAATALKALQVQEQLGGITLSIANASPQALLGLR